MDDQNLIEWLVMRIRYYEKTLDGVPPEITGDDGKLLQSHKIALTTLSTGPITVIPKILNELVPPTDGAIGSDYWRGEINMQHRFREAVLSALLSPRAEGK